MEVTMVIIIRDTMETDSTSTIINTNTNMIMDQILRDRDIRILRRVRRVRHSKLNRNLGCPSKEARNSWDKGSINRELLVALIKGL